MKILDRYVIKSFFIGYVIAFCVLIGLRVITDLFVNLDEFTEHTAELGALAVARNVLSFYLVHSTVYFRDFAGMITVVAAVFSLGRMVRSNELVAVMASGVSLKRVIAPIIVLSVMLIGVLVVDRELVIPALADKVARRHDTIPGQESYDLWFITDENGSLICSKSFEVSTRTMHKPTILTRTRNPDSPVWQVTGWISAEKAVYNPDTGKWNLVGGKIFERGSGRNAQPLAYYETDITPKDIPIRRKSRHKDLLSWRQLNQLSRQGTGIKDLAQLYSQMHFHVTEPVINLVMLLVSLPILVCRDPKTMKSAIIISFVATTACFLTTFVCRMFATEVVLYKVRPELWAWLPVFIFLPIAFIELDSMKT